jgi:hypothetical protein
MSKLHSSILITKKRYETNVFDQYALTDRRL